MSALAICILDTKFLPNKNLNILGVYMTCLVESFDLCYVHHTLPSLPAGSPSPSDTRYGGSIGRTHPQHRTTAQHHSQAEVTD